MISWQSFRHLGREDEMMREPVTTDSGRTVIVRLSVETHKALRIRVAEQDTSIQKWVESLIERELGLGTEPGTRKRSR